MPPLVLNPSDAEIRRALAECRRIAVVGLSPDPARPSHDVARYMQQHGYQIIPVNPKEERILGERCYPDLAAIPGPVEIVDVFRRSEHLAPIAAQAVAKGAKVLWMQQGVVNAQAARVAEQAGLLVVQDSCLKIEHARLLP
ncbi:MAG: CoA-binding protein [Desulfarculus sp.]|nr:MAG: CoA-binding protein [Desulfarculus sp.]